MDSELRSLTAYRSDDGKVRLDNFAIKTGVHAKVASCYLERKAHQLNGLKYVDSWGDTIYFFGESKQKMFQQIMESDRNDT